MLRLFKNRINYKDFADSIYSLPRTSTVERNHSAKPRRVCWERKSAISDRFRFLTVHRLTSYIKHTVILFFLKDFWAQAIAKIKTAPIFPSLNFQALFFYLGGGPFHLWSTSHISWFRPTRRYPGLQVYSIILLNCRVPFTNLKFPFTMSAGIPHSKSRKKHGYFHGQN